MRRLGMNASSRGWGAEGAEGINVPPSERESFGAQPTPIRGLSVPCLLCVPNREERRDPYRAGSLLSLVFLCVL